MPWYWGGGYVQEASTLTINGCIFNGADLILVDDVYQLTIHGLEYEVGDCIIWRGTRNCHDGMAGSYTYSSGCDSGVGSLTITTS